MIFYLKNIFITILLILFIHKSNYSENITLTDASGIASDFILEMNMKFDSKNYLISSDYFIIADNEEILAFAFNVQPQGFVIVSAFETNKSVIGFSIKDNLPEGDILHKLPAYSIIKGIAYSHKYVDPVEKPSDRDVKSTSNIIYGPHVNTLWGQVNCHNDQGQLINVTNYYTPNHYAAGCVAISLSTLLHYYKWPVVGEGNHQYYDGWGSSTGSYEADFGNTYYKWDLMLDLYNNQPSTDSQREASGELAFHAAVALEMNFEYNGSTANVNEIPGTGSDYFRFYSFYKQESSPVFWPRLDKNMIEENPVILAVETNSGFGHSIVCDGLWITDNEERYYHLNMGWWGSGNGWFTIQEDFNAGGYTTINGGVLDFIPKPIIYNIEIPADTNMFHLTWQYSNTIDVNAYEVQHKINTEQWETITDDYHDTTILIVVDDVFDDHYFRVRASVNDEWYPSTWSNVAQLQIITGIENVPLSDFAIVSPNPFNDNLSIIPSEYINENSTISIYDIAGKLFYHSKFYQTGDQINITTSTWSKGVYFVKIFSEKTNQVYKTIKK